MSVFADEQVISVWTRLNQIPTSELQVWCVSAHILRYADRKTLTDLCKCTFLTPDTFYEFQNRERIYNYSLVVQFLVNYWCEYSQHSKLLTPEVSG